MRDMYANYHYQVVVLINHETSVRIVKEQSGKRMLEIRIFIALQNNTYMNKKKSLDILTSKDKKKNYPIVTVKSNEIKIK